MAEKTMKYNFGSTKKLKTDKDSKADIQKQIIQFPTVDANNTEQPENIHRSENLGSYGTLQIIKKDTNSSQHKIFAKNGKLLYKGGMKADLKHGFGRKYSTNGSIKFEGSFKLGNYHGKNCKEYFHSGNLYYKGDMVDGKKEGQGALYHPNSRQIYSSKNLKNPFY